MIGADESWAEAGPERTERALAGMRAALERLEARLLAGTDPLASADAVGLIRSLDGLSVRLARQEASARGRADELARAVATLTARLEAEAAARAAREVRFAEGQARIAARLETALAAASARPADPGPVKAVLVASAALAALAVTGAGVTLLSRPGEPPPVLAERPSALATIELRPMLRSSREPLAQSGAAVAPGPATPAAVVSRESFAAVVAALRRGEGTAIARLTGLAQAGDPEAQLHLAGLYEGGQAGLPRDLAAARLWTRRAAGGGDRVAMHNLGLFLSEGEGGPRDMVEAAVWFRRAAERGVVDSQYNLGVILEAGTGVPRNLREAYRWFTIAANAGDVAARERQIEVEGRLSAAERAGLDRDVSAFQPGLQPLREADLVIPPATTLAETQAMLARRGYYVGRIDGVASPQFRAAAAAYLHDHPEVENGP